MRLAITQHALLRFVERVAPGVCLDEAQSWLETHARHATPLPARTRRGQRQWYLPTPYGRDAVLVTKDDPGGVLVVVTAGWFEHETDPDPDEVPRPTVALVPPPVPTPRRKPMPPPAYRPAVTFSPAPPAPPSSAWTRPAWLPPRPADLPAPPGALRVGLDAEDQTLALGLLSYDDLIGWQTYLKACFSAYTRRGLPVPAVAVEARRAVKEAAKQALDARIGAREAATRAMVDSHGRRLRFDLDHLVVAVGEVLRERLGELESADIFSEAKARMVAAAATRKAAE